MPKFIALENPLDIGTSYNNVLDFYLVSKTSKRASTAEDCVQLVGMHRIDGWCMMDPHAKVRTVTQPLLYLEDIKKVLYLDGLTKGRMQDDLLYMFLAFTTKSKKQSILLTLISSFSKS